ncbi:MAG: alpha/beta fold hydrolase [Bacteroidales bacterium]
MKLFFRHYGEDHHQPMVILHGLFGISDNWVTFGRRIGDYGFNVYIPDQRNHGNSPHSKEFDYLCMVDDLKQFLEENHIENPIIIGHSMGGKVAMRFALEYPEKVKKLVIVDISLRSYPPRFQHQKLIQAMKKINLQAASSRKDIERQLFAEINNQRLVWFLMKNIKRLQGNRFIWRINLDGILNNLPNMFDGIFTDIQFNKPSLFIKGGNSDYIQLDDYDDIRHNFPQAEIITIDNTSHWVHAEAPERFFQLVSGFTWDSGIME